MFLIIIIIIIIIRFVKRQNVKRLPWRRLIPWPPIDIQVKFYRDRPMKPPPSGELNTRGVAKYSDFGPIERYISETVQDRS